MVCLLFRDLFFFAYYRWFSSSWKDLCMIGNEYDSINPPPVTVTGASSSSSSSSSSQSVPRAPLERRLLWSPTASAPQGSLVMWMDVLSLEDAKKHPPRNITPPAPEEWELRIVVWSACDVPLGDPFEEMNDLYIMCSLGGDKYKSTDTHLRLAAGKTGHFNFRMKFPVSLPVSEDSEGGTKLYIQVQASHFLHYLLLSFLITELIIYVSVRFLFLTQLLNICVCCAGLGYGHHNGIRLPRIMHTRSQRVV
jgi:hypothetical protein